MDRIKELVLKLIDKIWEILSKYLGSKEPEFTEVGITAIEDTRKATQQITDAVIVEESQCCGGDCGCDGNCGNDCKCKEEKVCVCGDKDCDAKEARIVEVKEKSMSESTEKKDKRKVYHVVPGPNGWLVKEEKNKNPSARADRKADAVKRAKELAKKAKLGQVIVHKKDGKIQTEYTYGKDPRSTKG
jgi:hypothetical protein